MFSRCDACNRTPNEASSQHSYCQVCGLANQPHPSPIRAAGCRQFTHPQVLKDYSVGEISPEYMRAIREQLDLYNNTGAIKLADYLHLNLAEFWTLQKSTSTTEALFKMCFNEGIKMDRIFQGLITINSDGANIIQNNLNDIHDLVRYKRAQQRLHQSGDPQQNTDSCPSLSDDDPLCPCSSTFTCQCGSSSMASSQHSSPNQPPNDTTQSLGSHYYYRNSNHQSNRYRQPSFGSEQHPSLNYHSYIHPADSSTHTPSLEAISHQYPDDLERPPRFKRDTTADVHKIGLQISNLSSDEEWDECPKKRKVPPRPKAYIFITGGNSSHEMKAIREQLGKLSLPYKLKWDSSNLIDESREAWERTFSEAAIIMIGLTKDYAANISRGGDWPSRAKIINQYVQRELTNNNRMNKRFISVIMTKSGLKKDGLPCELSGAPFTWPGQRELLTNRVKDKMDKILKIVK